jgi:hypothetical protein
MINEEVKNTHVYALFYVTSNFIVCGFKNKNRLLYNNGLMPPFHMLSVFPFFPTSIKETKPLAY